MVGIFGVKGRHRRGGTDQEIVKSQHTSPARVEHFPDENTGKNTRVFPCLDFESQITRQSCEIPIQLLYRGVST